MRTFSRLERGMIVLPKSFRSTGNKKEAEILFEVRGGERRLEFGRRKTLKGKEELVRKTKLHELAEEDAEFNRAPPVPAASVPGACTSTGAPWTTGPARDKYVCRFKRAQYCATVATLSESDLIDGVRDKNICINLRIRDR